MKISFLLLVIAVANLKNSDQCPSVHSTHNPSKTAKLAYYSGQQHYSLALLRVLNKILPKENFLFSPYSSYHALLIMYFFADGNTKNDLRQFLFPNYHEKDVDIYSAYKLSKVLTSFKNKHAHYNFTSANDIFIEKTIPINDCMTELFLDELKMKNFKTDAEKARLQINQWVESFSRNKIKDIMPSWVINSSTKLVMVTATYFEGIWKNKFPLTRTRREPFFLTTTQQQIVDIMIVEGTFKHGISQTLGTHILEMPYEDDDVSMYIFLPPFVYNEQKFATMLENFTVNNFRNIVEGDFLVAKPVTVKFPKFKIETILEMSPILENMGVGDLFTPTSDISKEFPNNKVELKRSHHVTKIEVNELGTNPSAISSGTFETKSLTASTQFVCNHPFIYVVYEKSTKLIYFSGIFRKPSQKVLFFSNLLKSPF